MKILVAGVGNIFLGDDGFGVEVARRLEGERFPPGVSVAEYGIRSVHLAYELLRGYDTLVLIDAVSRGETPGSLFVLERDGGSSSVPLDAHGMNPEAVIETLGALGGRVERILIVGCEPETLEEGIGLSAAVSRKVDKAANLVRELVVRELGQRSEEAVVLDDVAKG